MKILHTADLHLRREGDERWEALKTLIAVGKSEKADLLVIAGDLFDKGIDAEKLRPEIRRVFSSTGLTIVILPGNHDKDSYREGTFFGDDAVLLTDADRPFEHGGVCFWGLPFVPGDRERVLARLHELAGKLAPDRVNVLVYHGELIDASFPRADFGDEGTDRYMPCRLSWFADLGLSYVLAGHFHSNFDIMTFGKDAFFVYPGSPVSITKKETGRRRVDLIEVGKPPAELALDTPHYVDELVVCDPFSDKSPVDLVGERLAGLHPHATALLSVGGFIDGVKLGTDETRLLAEIRKVAKKQVVLEDYSVRDVSSILTDELFATFSERLSATEPDDEKRARIARMVIGAMMEAAR
jgi:exonuclease SbcD